MIKRFRTNVHVAWALSNAWDGFDSHEYAREVLAHIPCDVGVTVRSQEQLTELSSLQTVKVAFRGSFTAEEMAAPLASRDLQVLNIDSNAELSGLDFLHPYAQLLRLGLFNCPHVTDLTPLAAVPSLVTLELDDCKGIDIEGLKALPRLGFLSLNMAVPHQDVGALPVGTDLTRLPLGGAACESLTLDGITRWPNLTWLSLGGHIAGFPQAAKLLKLEDLILADDASLSMLKELPTVPQVTELWLGSWHDEDDLALVRSKLPSLRRVTVWAHERDTTVDLTPLRDMVDLTIYVHGAPRVLGAEHFPVGAVIRNPRPRE